MVLSYTGSGHDVVETTGRGAAKIPREAQLANGSYKINMTSDTQLDQEGLQDLLQVSFGLMVISPETSHTVPHKKCTFSWRVSANTNWT